MIINLIFGVLSLLGTVSSSEREEYVKRLNVLAEGTSNPDFARQAIHIKFFDAMRTDDKWTPRGIYRCMMQNEQSFRALLCGDSIASYILNNCDDGERVYLASLSAKNYFEFYNELREEQKRKRIKEELSIKKEIKEEYPEKDEENLRLLMQDFSIKEGIKKEVSV